MTIVLTTMFVGVLVGLGFGYAIGYCHAKVDKKGAGR